MLNFAATNLQLFNQLLAQGYAQADLKRIHKTYERARLLFSGRFIASGRTQLAHCVGTASILAFWNAPAHVVAAGLVHNVYNNGDLGDGRRGISEQRRIVLREILGQEIEEEVANFAMLKWNEENISHFLLGKGPLTSNLVFLRLADILDHSRDGGLFYDQKIMKSKRNLSKRIPPFVIQTANALGLPSLGKELERVKRENDSLQPLRQLHEKFGVNGGFNVLPPSYAQKTFVKLLKVFARFWPSRGPSWSMGPKRKLMHRALS